MYERSWRTEKAPFMVLIMICSDLEITSAGGRTSALSFLRKWSKKAHGVYDCNLHFMLVNNRSSILCIVLPLNKNLYPSTCKQKHLTHINNTYINGEELNSVSFTCISVVNGTLISSILAAKDKQVKANNCTAQVLFFYESPDKQDNKNSMCCRQ